MTARSRAARKNRVIRRFRVLLLLALIATVAVVAVFFVRGRLEEESPSATESVGPDSLEATGDIVTVGEGFERTVTEEDRPLFAVRGERYAVDRDGQVYLDGVEVTVFHEGQEEYEIRSPEAWFRPEERKAQLTGGVTVSGGGGLVMETETLRVTHRGRVIQSVDQIYVRLGDRLHARADRLRVQLRAQQFRMLGDARVLSLERSPVPFEMTSQYLIFDRSRHLIEAREGPVLFTHHRDWLSGERVTVFLDEAEERVRYVRAEGMVVAVLRSSEVLGDETDGSQGREGAAPDDSSAAEDAGDDPVSRTPALETGDASGRSRVHVHTESFDMEMTADGRHPSRLQMDRGPGGLAVLRSYSADGGSLHRLRAPQIDGRFTEGRPEHFEAGTGVTLAVVEGDDAQVRQEIADELAAWKSGLLGSDESLEEPVAPGGEAARRAQGRRAEVSFDNAGELSAVTLFDRVVISDLGAEGETRARGEKGIFRAAEETVEVTGSPARVVTPRVEMDAPSLLYTRTVGILHGTGGVRARMEEADRSALGGTPLAEGEGPVRVEADEGLFRDAPRSFLFRGGVRAWRGENLLTADQLRGDDAEQRLLASGDVRTLWREETGAAVAQEAGDGPVEVTADRMRFERDRRLLVYSGDVVSEQQGRVVACQGLRLFLTPEGAPQGNEIERFVCTGEVVVTEAATDAGGARILRGHRAVYLPADRTIEVFAAGDGIVTMEDSEGNIVEGPRMIYEIDRERVQVLPGKESPDDSDDAEPGEAAVSGETPEGETTP